MKDELLSSPIATFIRQFFIPGLFFLAVIFIIHVAWTRFHNQIGGIFLVALTSFFAIVIAKESLKVVSVRLVRNELHLSNALQKALVPFSEISNVHLSQDIHRGNTTINIEFNYPTALGSKVRFFPNTPFFDLSDKTARAMVYRLNALAQTGHEPHAQS